MIWAAAFLALAQPMAVEPTIAIVELPRGLAFAGFPRVCPGDTAEIDPEEGLCIAELYQGDSRVVRRLSGPQLPRRGVLRLTSHGNRWGDGSRLLVILYPFEDRGVAGLFAPWWHQAEENGEFCLETSMLARPEWAMVARAFKRGRTRRFRADGYVERAEFRCVGG